MKNKTFIIFSFLFFICSANLLFAQNNKEVSEIDIYNEINIYANAKYYPGVIDQVQLLESNFPESVFIIPARIEKAQALIILNRYDEAIETLEQVIPSLHFGSDSYSKCWFLSGQAYYFSGDYTHALNSFYTACDIEKKEAKLEYYHLSILYAARINFFFEKYDESIPLFEYVISNGTMYQKGDYSEALQKLMFAYNAAQKYKKTISLYSKINPDSLEPSVYSALTIYTADAYENDGQFEKAYETLNSNNNQNFREMLSAFRINLGVSAYNKKDYESAKNYFVLAKDTDNQDNLLIIFIYEQKIILDTKGKKSALEVEQALLQNEDKILSSTLSGLNDSYYGLLLRTKTFGEQKVEQQIIKDLYEKIDKPGAKDAYIAASCLIDSDSLYAQTIIAPFVKNQDCAKLYAQILAKNQKYSDASLVYENLYKLNTLSPAEKIEYSKVLYRLSNWNKSKEIALEAKEPLSLYIAGLCDYNLSNYNKAYDYLRQYNSSKNTEPQYKKIATYYWGYCAYKQNLFKEAYTTLSNYTKNYKQRDEYLYKAYELSAKSALMLNKLNDAAVMAQGMIDSATTLSKKQEAIIYCSEIYTDCQEYEKAIKVLNIYSDEKSDFNLRTLFQTAKIYEKKGDLDNADSIYQKIIKNYAGTPDAETAAYRCAEVFYAAYDYEQAEKRFTKYLYDFVGGKYSDAAYYFSGDCNMKLNDFDKAIMQNNTLVSKYPKSVYCYGAYKNLLEAYYTQENYKDALSTAKRMIRDYNEQASSDGIGNKIVELERIVGGTDREIVEKTGEYERAGKTSTKKGRIAGSQLVQLYVASNYENEAFELALELVKNQTGDDEKFYAAQNTQVIAEHYLNEGQNQKAAEQFLKAAEYYRASSSDESDKAASALYSATSAFVSANLKGDAELTAKLLIELYPESKQSKKVQNLIK